MQPIGTSKNWAEIIVGTRFLDDVSDAKPEFCAATAVCIPYCDPDAHRGTSWWMSETTNGGLAPLLASHTSTSNLQSMKFTLSMIKTKSLVPMKRLGHLRELTKQRLSSDMCQ